MPTQLLDEPEAENGLCGGMVKDMKADQAAVKVFVVVAVNLSLVHLAAPIGVIFMALPTPTTHPATTFLNTSTEMFPSTHFPESVLRKRAHARLELRTAS
jgi:hypothetical protein